MIPALAVAAELRRRGCHQVLMVGTPRGLEARLAPAHGVRLETIEVGALNRVGPARVLGTLFRLPHAFWQAGRILARFGPGVVYGVGGYASGPVLFMAAMRGTPIVVHEPNAMPGFANRLIAPYVSRALLAFPEAARFFPPTRWEVVGVPVRSRFFAIPVQRHCPPYTILISGGSQGARRINEAVVESLPLFLAGEDPPFLIHQTGEKDFEKVRAAYAENGYADRAEVVRFIDDMPAAFERADLLVCRSGASTLFEITAAGKASILVPFPFAADDHQLKNARSLESAGAARVLLDAQINGRRLFEAIRETLPRLEEMERYSRRLAKPHAAESIVDVLEAVALQ